MTKAAGLSLAEVLYGQLRAAGSRIGVSVLFPGPKVLKTGLLTSAQHRPTRWSNDGAPPPAATSIEAVEARLRAAGVEPDYTPVEDVAEEAFAGGMPAHRVGAGEEQGERPARGGRWPRARPTPTSSISVCWAKPPSPKSTVCSVICLTPPPLPIDW